MKIRNLYKAYSYVIAALFIAAVFVPLIAGIIEKDKKASTLEKRSLTMIPSFPKTIQDIRAFPQAFNEYYSDHFGFRQKFNKRYFRLVKKLLPNRNLADVTFGKDDWMFLGSIAPGYDRFGDPMGHAMNVKLYSEEELEEAARNMMKVKNWLAKRGVEYMFVIAPNKHTIYFELLPEYITKKTDKSATDQLVEYLRKNTDIHVVDLRQVLLDAKGKGQLYYKFDTHWNSLGANEVQFAIMKKIAELFPGKVEPLLLDQGKFDMTQKEGGDLATFANLEGLIDGEPVPVFGQSCNPIQDPPNAATTDVHSLLCEGQSLSVLIYRDSFFEALKPYFSRKLKKSTFVWESKITYASLAKNVEAEKPDLVIEERLERFLPHEYDFDSEIEKN